jgi:hypothetical protein
MSLDIESILSVIEQIHEASLTVNADSDEIMDLFKTMTQLLRRWDVGVTAEYRNQNGRVLAFRRYGKEDNFQFVVLRPDSDMIFGIGNLKRHERFDIIHQLPGLLRNIHAKLMEQKAERTPVSDLVARLELLLDANENA